MTNWWTWLAAALWVNLGEPLACFLLGLFGWLTGLIQYLLNTWLSWFYWVYGFLDSIGEFLAAWSEFIGGYLAYYSWVIGEALSITATWLGQSFLNILNWIGITLTDWSNWIGQSLANIYLWIAAAVSEVMDWIGNSLANTSLWIGENLALLSRWIGESLVWLWNGLINLLAWLGVEVANLVRAVFNWVIAAWNALLPVISAVMGEIVDLAVRLWNYLAGYLSSLSWSTSTIVSLTDLILDTLLGFLGSGWDLFVMLLTWIWENIFSIIGLPLDFYQAFSDGISSNSFAYLLTCENENLVHLPGRFRVSQPHVWPFCSLSGGDCRDHHRDDCHFLARYTHSVAPHNTVEATDLDKKTNHVRIYFQHNITTSTLTIAKKGRLGS